MKKTLTLFALAGTVIVAGCDQKGSTAPTVKKEDAIASVNGQYISKKTLEDLEKDLAQRSNGQAPNFPKEKLVDELIQREILVQDAMKKKLDQTPEVIAQLDAAKKAILTQASLQDYLKTNPVTDAELKKEYDSKVGGANGTEYKASHILVKTEDEAKKLTAELDKGGKFATLANKHSLDAKESQNGGDLGWFNPSQMVPPFSEAVAKLEKGKYTKAPIKTQFGWHVIWLEDSRKQAAPPFEAVKEQLKPMLQRQKIQTMVENLRKSAKVENLLPKEEPKPVTPPPVPASGTAPDQAAPPTGATPTPPATPSETAKPADAKQPPAEPAKK